MTRPRFRVIKGGRRWTRAEDFGTTKSRKPSRYGPSGSGWRKYAPLWLASVLIGLVVAFEFSGSWNAPVASASSDSAKLSSDILWNEVQPARQAVERPEDRAWAARAEQPMAAPVATESGAASSGGGERVSFGFCHVGGGTNCVVDGDTFYLNGQKIRIAGIDAPETHDYRCAAEKALGDRATRRLQELLNSGAPSLSSIDRDEDVYGRKLRNVAVNGADVGDTLISEGLSRAYRGAKMGWC